MDRFVLTLNAGSSSLKYALFGVAGSDLSAVERGNVEIRSGGAEAVLSEVRQRLDQAATGLKALAGVGHRVVHGGPRYFEPERITPQVIAGLRELGPLDPEHLPAEIELIEAAQREFGDVPHIACFDTAFHRDLPRLAQLLPLPRQYQAQGLRRYGFHGLSCQFLAQELGRLEDPAIRHGRVIFAHLGSGASLTAVKDGQSFDTSMGFTPAAGLVMSTRTGDLDPGLAAYFAHTERMGPVDFQHMINHRSGLLGVSGLSADLRELLAAEATSPAAADAVGLFCYQVKKWIGSYAAAMGGLDTLVFAGGIGEHLPSVRQRICEGLGFLGVSLDDEANAANAALISAPAGQATVRVIRTDEEVVIARSVLPFLAG
jgi:acetate kinase